MTFSSNTIGSNISGSMYVSSNSSGVTTAFVGKKTMDCFVLKTIDIEFIFFRCNQQVYILLHEEAEAFIGSFATGKGLGNLFNFTDASIEVIKE
ncbi:MAG: hypothetical protein HXX11_22525 [Desulfuromonadales bacterium]|nr:hypothetical protein [Desulfuromonadales bacterium]